MQRRALGLLFAVLTLALAAIAVAALVSAHGAGRVVVGVAALALAAWMGSVAFGVLRRRR